MLALDWKTKFLKNLTETGNVSASCRIAGIARQTAYEARKDDAEFATAWDDSLEEGIDLLEQIAKRRAASDSDTLLIFLLKAHRPQKYRENVRVDQAGTSTLIVKHVEYSRDYLAGPPPGPEKDPD